MSRRWTAITVALLLAGAGASGTASADDRTDAQKKVAAQALFDDARRLTKAGQYAEACPKLKESQKLDPTLGTKFYLAECLEHVGWLATAWTYYLEVADAAKTGGQKDREKYASERAAALAPRLTRLAIRVPDEVRGLPDLTVERNDVPVSEAEWGVQIPIDLGKHLVRVRAKDRKTWETTIEASQEGASLEVKVPVLERVVPPYVPPPAPEPAEVPPPDVVPPPPPPPPPRVPVRRIAGFVVGGAGLVGVGIGTAFGVVALNKKSESNAGHCDAEDTCDGTGLALRSDGLAAANASTVGFVLGGLALAGGVALIVTAPSAARPAVPRAAVGAGGASLAWTW